MKYLQHRITHRNYANLGCFEVTGNDKALESMIQRLLYGFDYHFGGEWGIDKNRL
ncbi:hypothetical protein [Pedobacter gandavensis]|uniref:Uncharacterized protein n=1 Tax=Pedobacter gandavensis TaxID=2679963 RepID=A0ABR6ETM5_9SPHI|nr:hypothetical protein [Pedobacter gandavensis]MBB2148614.1 hypothetical protein [Pedobacter gandavensis]